MALEIMAVKAQQSANNLVEDSSYYESFLKKMGIDPKEKRSDCQQ